MPPSANSCTNLDCSHPPFQPFLALKLLFRYHCQPHHYWGRQHSLHQPQCRQQQWMGYLGGINLNLNFIFVPLHHSHLPYLSPAPRKQRRSWPTQPWASLQTPQPLFSLTKVPERPCSSTTICQYRPFLRWPGSKRCTEMAAWETKSMHQPLFLFTITFMSGNSKTKIFSERNNKNFRLTVLFPSLSLLVTVRAVNATGLLHAHCIRYSFSWTQPNYLWS